jgi:hypothetical protein
MRKANKNTVSQGSGAAADATKSTTTAREGSAPPQAARPRQFAPLSGAPKGVVRQILRSFRLLSAQSRLCADDARRSKTWRVSTRSGP